MSKSFWQAGAHTVVYMVIFFLIGRIDSHYDIVTATAVIALWEALQCKYEAQNRSRLSQPEAE